MTSSGRRTLGVALTTVTLTVVGAWWRPAPLPLGIVLITLDTTRADRLSPYGLVDTPMPALERIAREGVVFDQATTVAPLTLPAHTSMLTGLFPTSHGVRDNADPALANRHVTLAEVLRGRGFRTGASVGSVVLQADRGLAQGFDFYGNVVALDHRAVPPRQRGGDEVIADAVAWLEQVGRSRFFLWAHLYEPHRPYDPPEPYRSRHSDPYVAEIAFADAQIGRLLDVLDRRGLTKRTIVVVAADHGESLGEHGERDHGIFVYQSVLRVPFMIRAPGIAPARVGAVVRLVDLMPTVLELAGVGGVTVPRMDGVSLASLMRNPASDPHLEAFAESQYPRRLGCSPPSTLRQGRFKVIDAPRPELYDLGADPFEDSNVYEERRPLAEAMIRRLRAFAEVTGAGDTAHDRPVVAADVMERLAALGYVSSPGAEPGHRPSSLPDPKDCVGDIAMRGDRTGLTSHTRRR